jgi:hypothetical protein
MVLLINYLKFGQKVKIDIIKILIIKFYINLFNFIEN